MLKSFTFGCGQGATKAMIQCIEDGVLDRKNCKVVNSTKKDIPATYLDSAIVISDDPDAGCGKVREAARQLMAEYIQDNPNALINLLGEISEGEFYPRYDYVNIMATTEGASGSGASVVLAQYIKQQLGIPVIITLITGFESDARGLQNTINYFKDLKGGDFVIRTISNKKYIDMTKNTFAAEKLANQDISKLTNIVEAKGIIDSDQNIDDTDLYKLITNPGMMFTGQIDINKKIKNSDQIEKMISDMVDYTTSLDFTPSATKIGIFMNVSDDTLMILDTDFVSIKKKLCTECLPELFIHKQFDGGNEFIRVIATGINLPMEEVSSMYDKYVASTEALTSSSDSFFDKIDNMDTANKLDTNQTTKVNKTDDAFFAQFSTPKNSEESSVLTRNRSPRKRRFGTSAPTSNLETTSTHQNNKFVTSTNRETTYNEESNSDLK